MKRYTFLFIFFFALFLSCKEDNEFLIFDPGDRITGRVDGCRDKHKWSATASAISHDKKRKILVDFVTYSKIDSLPREVFTLSSFPYKIGRYQIKGLSYRNTPPNVGVTYYIADWDVSASPIYSYNGENTYLNITKLDTINNIVEGNFTDLELVPVEGDMKGAPRCVVFKDCTFSATIKNK